MNQKSEAYNSGWTRGFYGCRNDDGANYQGPAGLPSGTQRDLWRAEFWRGFFAGKSVGMRRVSAKQANGSSEDDDPVFGLTLQVLQQFVRGSTLQDIASELEVTQERAEQRLRGAVSAILRFLEERPGVISDSAPTPFARQLLSLAHSFGGGSTLGDRAA